MKRLRLRPVGLLDPLVGGGRLGDRADQRAVPDEEVDDRRQALAAPPPGAGAGVLAPALGDGEQLLADIREQPQHQVGDVIEVAVEGGAGEARLGHHDVDRELAVRALAQEAVGGGEDLSPCALALLALARALRGRAHGGDHTGL